MPTDEPPAPQGEPRKKRAKIISACSECRRKKTKCNGELPCRSCSKSSVACVYPSLGNMDERRNAPNKAALEALEERLKSIEDMLKAILHSRHTMLDLDPVLVDKFLKDKDKQPRVASLTPSPLPSVSVLPHQHASPPRSAHTPPLTSSPPHPHPPNHIQRPVPTAPTYHPQPHRDNTLPPIQSLSVATSAYDRYPIAQDHPRDYYSTAFQSFRPLKHAHELRPRSSYSQPDEYPLEPSQDQDPSLESSRKRKR